MFSCFRTYEHYDGAYNNIQHDCSICYEVKDINNSLCVKLNQQNYYVKDCSCDIFIHISCLNKWYITYRSCPICREPMYYKNHNGLLYEFSYYVEQNICRVAKKFLFVYLFFILYIKVNFIIDQMEKMCNYMLNAKQMREHYSFTMLHETEYIEPFDQLNH
jgi:hypothetical protein